MFHCWTLIASPAGPVQHMCAHAYGDRDPELVSGNGVANVRTEGGTVIIEAKEVQLRVSAYTLTATQVGVALAALSTTRAEVIAIQMEVATVADTRSFLTSLQTALTSNIAQTSSDLTAVVLEASGARSTLRALLKEKLNCLKRCAT